MGGMAETLPEHERRSIATYVESQNGAREDPDDSQYRVTLVQKVASRRLLGQDYDIYDVHTPEIRWWVITQMTNLYSQEDFPDFDTAFSFHVGLMMRLWERDGVAPPEDVPDVFGGAWRRVEAARQSLDSAREAEDYQGVGIRCREALLAFAREGQQADWLGLIEAPPKAGNFKEWSALHAEALTTGRFRSYLKESAARIWDLCVWLQHYTEATAWDAEAVVEVTEHLIGAYSHAAIRRKKQPAERCPRCGSYRFGLDGEVVERGQRRGWLQAPVCSACNFRGEETFQAWNEDGPVELEATAD